MFVGSDRSHREALVRANAEEFLLGESLKHGSVVVGELMRGVVGWVGEGAGEAVSGGAILVDQQLSGGEGPCGPCLDGA